MKGPRRFNWGRGLGWKAGTRFPPVTYGGRYGAYQPAYPTTLSVSLPGQIVPPPPYVPQTYNVTVTFPLQTGYVVDGSVVFLPFEDAPIQVLWQPSLWVVPSVISSAEYPPQITVTDEDQPIPVLWQVPVWYAQPMPLQSEELPMLSLEQVGQQTIVVR